MFFHYVITLQFKVPNRQPSIGYKSSTIEVLPGDTRHTMFARIFDDAVEALSADLRDQGIAGRDPVVLFFSLEDNTLYGGK